MALLGNKPSVRTMKWRTWEQKCPPDVFHIENVLSYNVLAYILNHSTGSINAISAHIYLFKVTPETLKKGSDVQS